MANQFFPNRGLFWSFWAQVLFVVGMMGYCIMDGLDYKRPDTLTPWVSSMIYVFLAALFVVDSSLLFCSLCHLSSSTHRYYTMVTSCLFDKIGSHAYLLGALAAATSFVTAKTIWTLNTIGVLGFVCGAASNMFVSGSSKLYSWANMFNLVGSLLYLLAILIATVPWTQIVVLVGDFVYLFDAILYTICWFSDRQLALA
jgi:hypothetical protein